MSETPTANLLLLDRDAKRSDQPLDPKTTPCPDCGEPLLPEDDFCPACARRSELIELRFMRYGWR